MEQIRLFFSYGGLKVTVECTEVFAWNLIKQVDETLSSEAVLKTLGDISGRVAAGLSSQKADMSKEYLDARKKWYSESPNVPIPPDVFGTCPMCHAENSKIIWGWDGVYYDLLCENGHDWTYNFPKVKA